MQLLHRQPSGSLAVVEQRPAVFRSAVVGSPEFDVHVDDSKERVDRLAVGGQSEVEVSHPPRAHRLVADDANEPPGRCDAVVVEQWSKRRNPDTEFRGTGALTGPMPCDGVDQMASERSEATAR